MSSPDYIRHWSNVARLESVAGGSGQLSLRETFKPDKIHLSVSDLCAPAYCSVKQWYRLQTGHGMPLEQRPKFLKTSYGTTMELDLEKIRKSEKILSAGQNVHAVFEKETNEVINLDTQDPDEYVQKSQEFGVKLVKIVLALRALLNGVEKVREVPVFGWRDSDLIFGIIDEVAMVDGQVQVRDLKTRQSRTLPAPIGARRNPAHLQVMLYQFMLRQHLQDEPFNWRDVFHKYKLAGEWSEAYVGQLMDLEIQAKGLDQVANIIVVLFSEFKEMVKGLTTNQLVYYSVPKSMMLSSSRDFRNKDVKPNVPETDTPDSSTPRHADISADTRDAPADSTITTLEADSQEEIPSSPVLAPSQLKVPKSSQSDPSLESSKGKYLGTVDVPQQSDLIDAHLESALAFWRAPADLFPQEGGAEIEEIFRCSTCEFINGCEWRLIKARQAAARNRQEVIKVLQSSAEAKFQGSSQYPRESDLIP